VTGGEDLDSRESPLWLSADEQTTWHAFQRMRTQFAAALRHAFVADADLPEAEYEVLAVLSDAPDRRLRARELRLALQWEKSRLSHRIRIMEAAGLVRRIADADLRWPAVEMTDAGFAAIDAAAPAHVARVRDLLFDVLTAEQQATLADVSRAISARLDERGLTEF
jgi:DNA-binding MarR family transcriptional regulator